MAQRQRFERPTLESLAAENALHRDTVLRDAAQAPPVEDDDFFSHPNPIYDSLIERHHLFLRGPRPKSTELDMLICYLMWSHLSADYQPSSPSGLTILIVLNHCLTLLFRRLHY
ncbi:hypothetical protein M569_16142 [Genlisea aurea]|uniref:Uncharacterized protein n=1 Tax=Genlisea aurea TaxID=192259 RepID=S8C2I7_9LAMI|nr:hypothetical protein M569_16142 [Genlisea aurea]